MRESVTCNVYETFCIFNPVMSVKSDQLIPSCSSIRATDVFMHYEITNILQRHFTKLTKLTKINGTGELDKTNWTKLSEN